jgi:flagella basal body P-ring formation protein FlgA
MVISLAMPSRLHILMQLACQLYKAMINMKFEKSAFTGRKQPFLITAIALLAGFSFCASAVVTPTTARKQIYAAAQKQATTIIQREAKKRGWPKYTAKLNIFVPAEATQLPACAKPLAVATPDNNRINLSRLRIDLRCTDTPGWTSSVAVKPDITMPIVMARGALERGHVLTEDDITMKKYNVTGTRSDILWRADDVLGMTVKRRLREMTPITPGMLEAPIMVERGQRIVMIASQDGVTAQTTGTAMKKGRRGEIIKVKNESSGQQVNARVTDFGTVTISK